jgi:hypothetical protein
MTKTLQEQIEARKEEAGRKDIFGKGRNVGMEVVVPMMEIGKS